MKNKFLQLVLLWSLAFSVNAGTLFGDGSGPVLNISGGYEPSANLTFGWGNWDNATLSYIYASYFLSYAPTKIYKNGKFPNSITQAEWDEKYQNLNSVYYDSIRIGYYSDSYDISSPFTGNVFLYHNSFRNFKNDASAMGDAYITGLGLGVDLGYVFMQSIKIYGGGDWLPNFLSFGGKLSNSSNLNIKGQYEIRAGIKYVYNAMFTFSFEWKWGRLQAVDYVYPTAKNPHVGALDSIEATIYNTGVFGVNMKF